MLKFILFAFLIPIQLFAQVDADSTKKINEDKIVKHLVLPGSLVLLGAVIKETKYRISFQNWIQSSSLRSNTKVDNYIQYVPVAELYISDLAYSRSKNEIFQQTKNLAFAEITTAFIVQIVKRTTNIKRPNGHDFSYFSGHTSQSFTSATALFLEYQDINPYVAYSGYLFSTTTGILRVTNNKHWISDVLVGAGIGMISARMIWYINPFQNWKPFKKDKVTIIPQINGFENKLGLTIIF